MEINIYKDKYIRAKNAYKNLEDDYNSLKEILITELEGLKREEYVDYDRGYNVGIEKFVKCEDEKPTLIQSILENCEVVNDAKEL